MQKIIVGIKRVVDYNVRIRVKPDGSGVMLDGVKMSVNPFDEIALEEALRIKERGANIEVVAVSIGVADTQQQLRTALAMGADRAILVQTDGPVEPLTAAQTFLALAKKENPDLIFLGKQAIDDDANQTGQMLAAIWDRPQATYASKVEIVEGKASVTREVDAGLETIEVDLPAVVTVDAVERAPVGETARHHEGQEEALGRDLARRAGRERGRAAQDREDRAAGAAPKRRDGQGRG